MAVLASAVEGSFEANSAQCAIEPKRERWSCAFTWSFGTTGLGVLISLQTTATFQHASDNTKGLSQYCRYLLLHPIFCSLKTIRLHSSEDVLQYCLEANHISN